MRRGVFETLRRGLDNTVVNWGLIVIRVVEVVAFALISIAAALAMVVPLLVSMGIAIHDLDRPEDFESVFLALIDKWPWLIGIFAAACVLLLVFIAVHSFVEAGCARVAIDADRAAGPALEGVRTRFRVFSMQRWMAGGKDGWWTVFWIYNLAWGVAGLILLIPLLPTLLIMLFTKDTPPVMIATGCVGLAIALVLMIVVGIATSMCTTRATANWAIDRSGASASLSTAWAAVKADLGRHIIIALAIVVIAMAGSSFFASFSYMAAFGEAFSRTGGIRFFTIPMRIFGTLLNWGFSAFVTSWYLAAYGALAVESSRKVSL